MINKNNILESEKIYDERVYDIFKQIQTHPDVRLILVAGPSCSGKTTTTRKLVELLATINIECHMISIDDYFHDVITPEGAVFGGGRDFESIDSIDLDALHECLRDLADSKPVEIPLFDFETGKRQGIRSKIILDGNDIAIIEGLHALNPVIYKNFVSQEKIFKVFLDCKNPQLDEKFVKFPRLLRRLVRDYNFRNADADKTFFLWKNVVLGEQKYIFPYSGYANASINTFYDYETALLKQYAFKILSQMQSDSKYLCEGQLLKEYLETQNDVICESDVPKTSMLREFIG